MYTKFWGEGSRGRVLDHVDFLDTRCLKEGMLTSLKLSKSELGLLLKMKIADAESEQFVTS